MHSAAFQALLIRNVTQMHLARVVHHARLAGARTSTALSACYDADRFAATFFSDSSMSTIGTGLTLGWIAGVEAADGHAAGADCTAADAAGGS